MEPYPHRMQQMYAARNQQDDLDAMLRALPPSPTRGAVAPAPAPTGQPAQQLTPQQIEMMRRLQAEEAARRAYEQQQELLRNKNMQQMYQQQLQQGWGSR